MRTTFRALATAAVAAGVVAAAAGPAGANVQVGSSGWQWGSPLPQGNALGKLSFAGPTGYAAGAFGTLLATKDGGATWTGLPSGTFQGLSEVQVVDADTVVAGGGCVGRRSDDGGRTFARIAFTPVETSCREQLAAMWFPSERVGFIVLTDGTVLQTADGGTEFAQKTAIPGTRSAPGGGRAVPTDAVFFDAASGYVTTSDGRILRTVDGGQNWAPVADVQRGISAIAVADATTMLAVGKGSLVLRSTDLGATWKPIDAGAPKPLDLRTVACASADLCAMTTERGDLVARTADGGQTFTFPAPSTDAVFAVGFASPTRLVAVGANGATVVSDDGGTTYAPVGGRLPGQYAGLRAGGAPGTAYALGGDGALARTADGGRSWTRGSVPTSEGLRDVAFPTATDGFALDTAGGVFRTTTGGTAWRPLDTGTTADPVALLAPAKDRVLLVGPRGIRRSSDAGETFGAVSGKGVSTASLAGADRAGGALVAYGLRALLRSTDGGRTWKALRRPGTKGRGLVRQADFVSATTGFVLDPSGRVFRTRDGARSWTELPGVATTLGSALAFGSERRGYLVIDRFGDVTQRSGFVLRTEDGGATWHPQFVVSDPITGLAAPGGGTDFLLGGSGSLLFSTTGGDAGAASTLTISTAKRRLSKGARIRVTGRLRPAAGGERVTVAARYSGGGWRPQTVKVAANGSFTTSWDVKRGLTQFVAQWQGDFRSHGDGSPTLEVRVGRR